jgi:hypothetical protein
MNSKRTNRINLSLTNKEFNDLQNFSDQRGKKISVSARELVQTSFFLAKMYNELEIHYKNKFEKSKNIKDDLNFIMLNFYQNLKTDTNLEYFKYERILTILKFVNQNKYWMNLDKKIKK